MVAIRKHPRRIANTYQPAQKDPRVPKWVPKFNRKIASPKMSPGRTWDIRQPKNITSVYETNAKIVKAPKEAMTPRVLTFATAR